MRLVRWLGVVMALLWIVPGCGERAEQGGSDVVTAAKAKPERSDGVVIVADRQLPVAPFVMHDPHLDLFVRCQMKRDAAKRAGESATLCFDPTRRSTTALRTLRVEKTGGDLGVVLRRLAATDEAAHFVVEKTGTPHQLLDVAYTARREGELRADELRIITCHEAAWKKLVDALTRLYPGLRVEVTDLPAMPEPPAPSAPSPDPATSAPAPGAPPSGGSTP